MRCAMFLRRIFYVGESEGKKVREFEGESLPSSLKLPTSGPYIINTFYFLHCTPYKILAISLILHFSI